MKMTLETIAEKVAKAVDATRKAEGKSAPIVAMILHAITTTKAAPVETLERLYMATFDKVGKVSRKKVQAHFTSLKALMSGIVDHGDHPDVAAAIAASLDKVVFTEQSCTLAEGAKKFPKSTDITTVIGAVRLALAADCKGEFAHDHADLSECGTVEEALKVLNEEVTRHSNISSSLAQYRIKIVNDAIGAPTDFTIAGGATSDPEFGVKETLN